MHRFLSQFFLIGFLCGLPAAIAQDKAEPASPNPKPAGESTEAEQSLRAYLQVQEQLHSAMLAIEQARKEAEAAAQRNNEAIRQARQDSEAAAQRHAELVSARLKLIEQTLTNQRDQEIMVMQKSNHVVLTIATIIAGIGLLGMMFAAFCLWRALARVAEITAAFQPLHALGAHGGSLSTGEGSYVAVSGPEASGTRLLGAIERLERRIYDLEHTALLPDKTEAEVDLQETSESNGSTPKAERVTALIDKGQGLLNSDQAEKAVACFDEALLLDPRNSEALVKKGSALERLKRLEDAIDCYDKAIAANQTMTVAYLHKGAVCNQLERFGEALECYEQALRTQQKAANAPRASQVAL
jgi:tetratricopeptide (TPR) repeat protein